jgi:hypothetical protein
MPGSFGEHLLQRRPGTVSRAYSFYDHHVLDRLNSRMQEFVARMDMVFIATADGLGEADCSFRAGPPGFVCVLDERTLTYPQYRGNGVMCSLGNIVENGHIGLLFSDFCGDPVGLHVNGRAAIVENGKRPDGRLLPFHVLDDLLQEDSRRPERWVRVDVEEAYIHCSKHIPKLRRAEVRQGDGNDEAGRTNGDYFKAKHASRPGVDGGAAGRSDRRVKGSRQ